jgi:arylsulfatase A-like enzyme
LLFTDTRLYPAVPGIIVVANSGVNYEPSLTSTTRAEHGGLGENETHVPLLVSSPRITPGKVLAPVQTTQIAPTILDLLNFDPNKLDAVRLQGTTVLPNIIVKNGEIH